MPRYWVGAVQLLLLFLVAAQEEKQNEGCGCSGASKGLGRSAVLSGSDSENAAAGGGTCSAKTEEGRRGLSLLESVLAIKEDMVLVPGKTFMMGTSNPIIFNDGEGPERPVRVSSFWMDRFEVSNAEYRAFAESTGYRTESEVFGWSFVFDQAIAPKLKKNIKQAVLGAEWWLPVNGSYWREPEGPGTDVFVTNRGNFPAVHISWTDAVKFCEWRSNGTRLPTEAEWELAARGGKTIAQIFPWGNKLTPSAEHRANIFQGTFPTENTEEDGYQFMAPVDAFGPQNELGLYNMVGNVWEWVQDWWTVHHSTELSIDPTGPTTGEEKVKRGGSFLCHRSFCYRYRTVARFKTTPDSATQNAGFRCARTAGVIDEGGQGIEEE